MFISKKKHNKEIALKDQYIKGQSEQITSLQITSLRKELEEARNLKDLLEKFGDKLGSLLASSSYVMTASGNSWKLNLPKLNLPDNVLVYEEDILGGKVIQQEGTKCLVIDKDGNVKTGLTKQKADKGYSYKLVRN